MRYFSDVGKIASVLILEFVKPIVPRLSVCAIECTTKLKQRTPQFIIVSSENTVHDLIKSNESFDIMGLRESEVTEV